MRIGGGGSDNANILLSDDVVFRGNDEVADDARAFFGGAHLALVAAQNTHIQLENPSGSGVTCMIDAVTVSLSAVAAISWGYYGTPLATLEGAVINKRLTGAVGKCLVRTANNAGVLGTQQIVGILSANAPIYFPFKAPIALVEGEDFTVACNTVNISMEVHFETREYLR